jgi:hypothetical protein
MINSLCSVVARLLKKSIWAHKGLVQCPRETPALR